MMSLIDDLAERQIQKALEEGVFNNLSGMGKPLVIGDNSHIPAELRMAYKILKNSGYIPIELAQRKQALALMDLLEQIDKDSQEYDIKARELQAIELKMQLTGVNTAFLRGYYRQSLLNHLTNETDKAN